MKPILINLCLFILINCQFRKLDNITCNAEKTDLANCICETNENQCDKCKEGFYDTRCKTECSFCINEGPCKENSNCEWTETGKKCQTKQTPITPSTEPEEEPSTEPEPEVEPEPEQEVEPEPEHEPEHEPEPEPEQEPEPQVECHNDTECTDITKSKCSNQICIAKTECSEGNANDCEAILGCKIDGTTCTEKQECSEGNENDCLKIEGCKLENNECVQKGRCDIENSTLCSNTPGCKYVSNKCQPKTECNEFSTTLNDCSLILGCKSEGYYTCKKKQLCSEGNETDCHTILGCKYGNSGCEPITDCKEVTGTNSKQICNVIDLCTYSDEKSKCLFKQCENITESDIADYPQCKCEDGACRLKTCDEGDENTCNIITGCIYDNILGSCREMNCIDRNSDICLEDKNCRWKDYGSYCDQKVCDDSAFIGYADKCLARPWCKPHLNEYNVSICGDKSCSDATEEKECLKMNMCGWDTSDPANPICKTKTLCSEGNSGDCNQILSCKIDNNQCVQKTRCYESRNSTECPLIPGCIYANSVCKGKPCDEITEVSECQAREACKYTTSCVYKDCSEASSMDDCLGLLKCKWDNSTNQCKVKTECEEGNQEDCSLIAGCKLSYSGVCQKMTMCSDGSKEEDCIHISGCKISLDENKICEKKTECSEGNSTDCSLIEGCIFKNNACSAMTECNEATSSSSCNKISLCAWSSSGCSKKTKCSQGNENDCTQINSTCVYDTSGSTPKCREKSKCDVDNEDDCKIANLCYMYNGKCSKITSCWDIYDEEGLCTNPVVQDEYDCNWYEDEGCYPYRRRRNEDSGLCIACSDNCIICSDTKCYSCEEGFYLENGACVVKPEIDSEDEGSSNTNIRFKIVFLLLVFLIL